MSGRSLRKLPVKALAAEPLHESELPMSVERFVGQLRAVVRAEKAADDDETEACTPKRPKYGVLTESHENSQNVVPKSQ